MRISTLAFANLKRRKGKALFLIIGIAIGIGTAISLLSLSHAIKSEIGDQLDRFGANIVVVPQSNSLTLDYGGVSVSGVSFDIQQLQENDIKSIREIPYRNRLSVVAPKLLGVVNLENKQVLLAGVDFKQELMLKRWWRLVGQKPFEDHDLVVGFDVARQLSLIEMKEDQSSQSMNMAEMDMDNMDMSDHDMNTEKQSFVIKRDRINLAGREHRISGVIDQTGGREDGMVFGNLSYVQSLLGKPGQISLVEVSALCKDCPVGDIVAQIQSKLKHAKVSAIQQSVQARVETVDRLTRFSGVVAGIVLIIGGLMIFTTMMGSVIERTKEIGVLRAIGFRKSHIMRGLILEITVISLLGGMVGWGSGTLISWLALPYFTETGSSLKFQPWLMLIAICSALFIGIVGSIYPAIRASKLDPSEALRYV
jgi:putative ABC transport system permease protein